MSVALSEPMPIRVSSGPLAPGAVVRGHEGFMKLNMQLDFANRSPNGRKLSVVARSFGPVGVGRVDGTPSSFYRRPCHLADGRDLLSIIISGGGRFRARRHARREPVRRPRRRDSRKPQRQRAAFARRQHRLDHLHGTRADGAAARRDIPAAAVLPAGRQSRSPPAGRLSGGAVLAAAGMGSGAGDAAHPRPRAERARCARRCAGAGARTRRPGRAAGRGTRRDSRARLRAWTRPPSSSPDRLAFPCATCTGCWNRPDGLSPNIFSTAGSTAPSPCCGIPTARI